jgi:hypothetical protein
MLITESLKSITIQNQWLLGVKTIFKTDNNYAIYSSYDI